MNSLTTFAHESGRELRAAYGDPANWTWGAMHRARFAEATLGESGIGPLEWYFDKGPFPAPGAGARVAGPCASFPMTDSWTSIPATDGVVLLGDAAGWSNPVIGQGLAVALRDAHRAGIIGRGENVLVLQRGDEADGASELFQLPLECQRVDAGRDGQLHHHDKSQPLVGTAGEGEPACAP